MIYRGWALADRGDVKAGIAQMRTGVRGHRDKWVDPRAPVLLGVGWWDVW